MLKSNDFVYMIAVNTALEAKTCCGLEPGRTSGWAVRIVAISKTSSAESGLLESKMAQ